MGLFGKKNKPTSKVEQAEQVMNKGLTGMLMKGFIPKEQRDLMNQSLASAKNAELAAAGGLPITATGIVVSVTDTGKLVNFDPIVILVLQVTEQGGAVYQKTMETLVSKMQIPRPGDRVGLGQHPANPAELIYMGLMPS